MKNISRSIFRMQFLAVILIMSLIFSGFTPAAGANYEKKSTAQETEAAAEQGENAGDQDGTESEGKDEGSEYYWNDGYYRLFLDDEDGEHLIGINVPSEEIESLNGGFARSEFSKSLSFSVRPKPEDEAIYVNSYFNLKDPIRPEEKEACPDPVDTVETRYGEADVFFAGRSNPSSQYTSTIEWCSLEIGEQTVYFAARLSQNNGTGEYAGILKKYLPGMLQPVDKIAISFPEIEEYENEIDPEDYDVVLASGQTVAFGLNVPDGWDVRSNPNEGNKFSSLYMSKGGDQLDIMHDSTSTYLAFMYHYFEEDSPFYADQDYMPEPKEITLTDEVMTPAGKVEIYTVEFDDDKDFSEELGLLCNNGYHVLLKLRKFNWTTGTPEETHLADILPPADYKAEKKHGPRPGGQDENGDGLYYRYHITSSNGTDLFAFNVPEEYQIEDLSPNYEGYFLSLGKDDMDMYARISTSYDSIKYMIDETEFHDGGTVDSSYGEITIDSGDVEIEPSYSGTSYYASRKETATIPLGAGKKVYVYLDIRYPEFEDYNEEEWDQEKADAEFPGQMKEFLPAILQGSEEDTHFSFEELEFPDSSVDADPEKYEYIIGNDDLEGIFGMNLPDQEWGIRGSAGSEDHYHQLRFDSHYKYNLEISMYYVDQHNNVDDFGGVLSWACHYFLDSRQFLNEYGTVLSVEEQDPVETDFGEMHVYYIQTMLSGLFPEIPEDEYSQLMKETDYDWEKLQEKLNELYGDNLVDALMEEEVGLIKNKGAYIMLRYHDGSYYDGSDISVYDGVCDGKLVELCEKMGIMSGSAS